MNTYNFTLYNLGTDDEYCYIYEGMVTFSFSVLFTKSSTFHQLLTSTLGMGMTLNCITHLWVKRMPQPGWQS